MSHGLFDHAEANREKGENIFPGLAPQDMSGLAEAICVPDLAHQDIAGPGEAIHGR